MIWQEIIQKEVYDPLEERFPDRPGNLAEAFRRAVEEHADKVAVVYEGRDITFREFGDMVTKAAHHLRYTYGVEQGDRVAVLLGTEPAFGIAVWAAASIGAIVCPMNTRYKEQELFYQLDNSDPKIIFADPDVFREILPFRGELSSLAHIFISTDNPPEGILPFSILTEKPVPDNDPFRYVEETDPAFIFYTAGTTGRPKGAVSSHRSIIYFLLYLPKAASGDLSEVLCIPVPLYYTGGCKMFLGSIYRGTKCIFLKTWKVEELLKTVEEYKVNNLFGLGSIWALLISSPDFSRYDLSSIRMVFYGGSATPASVITRVGEAFPHALQVQGYGMTECQAGTMEMDVVSRPTSCGFPHRTTQLVIADEHDQEVPAGEVGQVLIRNAQIFSGYWKNESATGESMRSGWFHSGDMGYLAEDGRLYVVGREKDMIIRGQENVYPAEIENVINRHPSVAEVAVLGVSDQIFGEQVKAVVVPREGEEIGEEEIRALCRDHLAEFKVPKYVEFRKEPLPRNVGGKVVKKEISG